LRTGRFDATRDLATVYPSIALSGALRFVVVSLPRRAGLLVFRTWVRYTRGNHEAHNGSEHLMADGPRYYRVSPKFWSSAERRGWDDDTRLLALYLLTCPHRTTEGIFRLPRKYVQADLEWSPQRFDERLMKLIADGFCLYDADAQVVLIMGAMKYQACANPNMAAGVVKRLAELPETSLTRDFKRLVERFDEQLAKQLPEGFGEPQALALTQALAPSPGESSPEGDSEDGESDADDPFPFEDFWSIYPARNGKRLGKANAEIEWRKLSYAERQRAMTGAEHLAASDQLPKDAERFLRRAKGGKGGFPFDDWQEPAEGQRSSTFTPPRDADYLEGWTGKVVGQ